MSVCGVSDKLARSESGRAAFSDCEGPEAYTVDSSVIRRISHFRRSSTNISGDEVGGG